MTQDLEYTGERVVPGKVNSPLWNEHMVRYLFAANFVKGKVVLDAGCGTGYGADLLASRETRTVLGVDISDGAIGYAQTHFRRSKLAFDVMDVTSLRLSDKQFDVITAFEVIEHLGDQERFMSEMSRIITKRGLFLVSTPNRGKHQPCASQNPFHTREFNLEEFRKLLTKYFRKVEILTQNYSYDLCLASVDLCPDHLTQPHIDMSLQHTKPEPQYFLALCSNSHVSLPRQAYYLYPFFYGREETLARLQEQTRPDSTLQTHSRLVRYLVELEQFEAAVVLIRSMERKLSESPEDGEWHYLAALCLHQARITPEEALNRYKLALQYGFDEFWVCFNRGSLLQVTGNFDTARVDLERAVALRPAHEGARKILQQILDGKRE